MAAFLGCNSIQTKPFSADTPFTEAPAKIGRSVEVIVDPEYFKIRPDCVFLVTVEPPTQNRALNRLVEEYFALHLSFRFNQVIFGETRDRIAARAGLDKYRRNSRLLIHKNIGCGYEIELRSFQARSDYAIVWAQLNIGLEARLVRIPDGKLLWAARHLATRSKGGLAISPLGVFSSSVAASALVSDGDQILSIVSDVTRRLVTTLP